MSLSKDALDTITATAIAASGAPLDTHVPAILIPDGYSLKSTEYLQARPARFRGNFNTYSITAFADYVKKHARPGESAGFIDQNAMSAQVIFDLGNVEYPGHCNHTARLELVPSPPFQAADKINGAKLNQKDMIEWLEDWVPHITTIGRDGDLLPLPAAIDAIRRMRIETKGARENEVGDFNAKRSALEEIEAKSAGQLPGFVHFTCIPYDCIDAIIIRMRLSVLTDANDDTPSFRLRWVEQEKQADRITESFREVLTDAIRDDVPLTRGTFSQ